MGRKTSCYCPIVYQCFTCLSNSPLVLNFFLSCPSTCFNLKFKQKISKMLQSPFCGAFVETKLKLSSSSLISHNHNFTPPNFTASFFCYLFDLLGASFHIFHSHVSHLKSPFSECCHAFSHLFGFSLNGTFKWLKSDFVFFAGGQVCCAFD